MKKTLNIGLAATLLLAFVLVDASHAQDSRNPIKYAQAGMPFLKIDVGSRISAMGGTSVAASGSVYDMFSNPAGLAFIDGAAASTTITSWIADIDHYGAGVAFNAGTYGVFGLSFVGMDYGTFQRTVPYEGNDPILRNKGYLDAADGLGTFEVNELAVGLAYARQISNQFYVGGHLRYASQDLGDVEIFDVLSGNNITEENKLNNVVFNFGTMYYTGWRDLRFGMSIRNFSNQSDYFNQRFELPLTFDFGMAMDVLPLLSEMEGQSLLFAVNWLHPRDFAEQLNFGAEYGFMDTVFLRAGYKLPFADADLLAEDVSAGVGVKLGVGGYGIDAGYAYSNFGEFFGAVNRVTIGVFGF